MREKACAQARSGNPFSSRSTNEYSIADKACARAIRQAARSAFVSYTPRHAITDLCDDDIGRLCAAPDAARRAAALRGAPGPLEESSLDLNGDSELVGEELRRRGDVSLDSDVTPPAVNRRGAVAVPVAQGARGANVVPLVGVRLAGGAALARPKGEPRGGGGEGQGAVRDAEQVLAQAARSSQEGAWDTPEIHARDIPET